MEQSTTRSGFTQFAVIGVVLLVVVAGVAIYYRSAGVAEPDDAVGGEAGIADEHAAGEWTDEEMAAMEGEGAMTDGEEGGTGYTGAVLAGTSAPLLDFTKADYDVALNSDKLVVLYFYANWCPICKAEFPKAQEAFNALPEDASVVGFRVNYKDTDTDETEIDLAKQFGIAYHHTKVFLKGGERILKATDTWTRERYLSEIEQAL